jgi:SAM-dependent methyltransferase
MLKSRVVKMRNVNNFKYYSIGLLFLFLNKIRHSIQGYITPRPFSIREFQKAIRYDFHVVERWMQHLNSYLGGNNFSLKGKRVLELGPGADLGIGLILLMKGVEKYNAMDVNELVKTVPNQFYEELFNIIAAIEDKEVDLNFLRSQLKLTQLGKNDKLNYICRKDFDLSAFKGDEIDLVFSQAAFEHFDDVENTIAQLSEIAKPGSLFIGEVDLKTHTRWIRDSDPLNIYRYSDLIYNVFKFSGSPNRVRPFEYGKILEKHGWTNIDIKPLLVLEKEYLNKVILSLNKRFRDPINNMDYLSVMIHAIKK